MDSSAVQEQQEALAEDTAETTATRNEEEEEGASSSSHHQKRAPRPRAWHPSHEVKRRRQDNDNQEDHVEKVIAFLREEAAKYKGCKSKNKSGGGGVTSCTCLKQVMAGPEEMLQAVAKFVVNFASKSNRAQKLLMVEWIRQGHALKLQQEQAVMKGEPHRDYENRRFYNLPYHDDGSLTINDDVLETILVTKICRHALLTISGKGRRIWETCEQAAAGNAPLKQHGLKNKPSNRSHPEEIYATLSNFFETLKKEHAVPLNDDDSDSNNDGDTTNQPDPIKYLLPKSFTLRNTYKRYCFQLGYNIKYSRNGTEIRSIRDDDEWGSKEPQKTISWHSFSTFWKQKFPELQVHPNPKHSSRKPKPLETAAAAASNT